MEMNYVTHIYIKVLRQRQSDICMLMKVDIWLWYEVSHIDCVHCVACQV